MFAYQRTSLVTHKIWSITETDTTKQIHVLYAITAYIFTNNITESISSNKNFNESCVNGAWWVFPQRQSHILIRYRYEDNGLGTSYPLRLKRNGQFFRQHFQTRLLYENGCILTEISLKLVAKEAIISTNYGLFKLYSYTLLSLTELMILSHLRHGTG